MLMEDLERAVNVPLRGFGRRGLSVYAGEGLTARDLLTSVPTLARYGSFRQTTVGTLVEAGFDLQRTGGPRHYTLWVGDDYIRDLYRLQNLFDPPEPNPLRIDH